MRTRVATSATALAVVVTAVAAVIGGILVLHVIFVLFEATPRNRIVSHITGYADDLAGPFRTLFAFTHLVRGREVANLRLTNAVNYGLAAVAYLVGGHVIGALLRRIQAP